MNDIFAVGEIAVIHYAGGDGRFIGYRVRIDQPLDEYPYTPIGGGEKELDVGYIITVIDARLPKPMGGLFVRPKNLRRPPPVRRRTIDLVVPWSMCAWRPKSLR